MRRAKEINVGEFYHLYDRGVSKQNIFLENRDYARFLFLILYFQSPVGLSNLSYSVSTFIKSRTFNIRLKTVDNIIKQRMVGLNTFCLMPNHFHLLVQEVDEGGIAKYMQRVLTAYANYFNTKYHRAGHLFENSYGSVHVEDNDQLLYTSAYIHKNPIDLKRDYQNYSWSSFIDYTNENRWGKLLDQKIILEQFDNQKDFSDWTESTTAKDFSNQIYQESDTL